MTKVVEILTGPPGCGKSTKLRADAINQPDRYMFFLPTIALIDEQVSSFRSEAPHIQIYTVYSTAGTGDVQRQLNDALQKIEEAAIEHAVIFTTHETLMKKDLSRFKDWHALIDESPNSTASGSFNVQASLDWFKNYFDIEDTPNFDWHPLNFTGVRPNWFQVKNDDLLKSSEDFMKCVNSPNGVLVNTNTWDDVKSFDWLYIWTPLSLSHFCSIKIAAASYLKSIGAIITQQLYADKISFDEKVMPMQRTGTPTIHVNYFTESESVSSTFWETSNGRLMIKNIADYLRDNVPDMGFWTGNAEVQKLMEHRVFGIMTKPKVAGQNQYREKKKCAIIYSSSSTPKDISMMKSFGITPQQIKAYREEEDIIQFVMRGAIRNPEYDEQYDIYVYSKCQADNIDLQLSKSGVGKIIVAQVDCDDIKNFDFDVVKSLRKSANNKPKTVETTVVSKSTGKDILTKSAARTEQRKRKKEAERLAAERLAAKTLAESAL